MYLFINQVMFVLMKIIKTNFIGVIKIQNETHKDSRGYFKEIWNTKIQKILKKKFVQENISFSERKNIFRGLHFQKKPFSQGKLLRVLNGEIIDVILNIDPKSIYFRKFIKIKLKKKSTTMDTTAICSWIFNNKKKYFGELYGN